jgi:Peptidyl-prolyl cis-trans isomerase (rotamase) - cyclophilin family
MIKHITTFIAISIFIVGCGSKEKGKESIMDKDNAVISTQFGDIVLEFFDDIAPKHVESFKLHAQNGYYNGTTFHRVIPGFMIQGGDPLTKSDDRSRHGTGGNAAKYFGIGTESDESTWDLPAEFNPTPHTRGILSMARSQNPDSGGSQFFICVADASFLDNQYTVFGKVVSGMDVVDAIVSAPRDARDNPNDRIEMKVRLEDKK